MLGKNLAKNQTVRVIRFAHGNNRPTNRNMIKTVLTANNYLPEFSELFIKKHIYQRNTKILINKQKT